MGSDEKLLSIDSLKISERHAVKVNQEWLPKDYEEKVDETIMNISFEPDIFQKQSFYFLSTNQSVFVSAHTSSGKTLVAEYAIYFAQKNGTRVIYTSPIKALSNQKFYDFKSKFDSVGLITGDIQVNPDAQCIIMTTEILRNLIYKNSDVLRDTEFIVFDEVHYINDPDRGVVWEESIIMAPSHISLVMLSATIPNAIEFSEWVGRTKNRCIYVISTLKRAVPLEFVVYADSEVFAIDEAKKDKIISNFKADLVPFSKKTKIVNRFRINDLGNFINNRKLTPAIFFSFSKRTCEEYGKSLQNLDLTNHTEKTQIVNFLDKTMENLREEDKFLPQIKTMREQAFRGVAVHHGALLPFVKECVEILFSMNLIKILIATETFAMGVNMPAKCVAFTSITKISNGTFRNLTNGEFIQMSGRAGRRGMDKIGTVIIADQRMPNLATIKKVISGIPSDLNSHFRLSFSLILMAIRSNIEVEDLMRNSFKEHGIRKDFTSDMIRLSHLESKSKLNCENCHDILEFLDNLDFICRENPVLLKKILKPGDIILSKENSFYKIIKIAENASSVEPFNIKIQGNLFNKESNFSEGSKEKNLTEISPINFKTGISKVLPFSDIIFLITNNKISFSYELSDLQYIINIRKLKNCHDYLESSSCIKCPEFENHYFDAIRTRLLFKEINNIKSKYADENLELMNEYSARVKFLEKYGFINQAITLKGRAAAEIRTVNDVLIVELIFKNMFKDFAPEELMAVFSAMINEEEEKIENFELYGELKDKCAILELQYNEFIEDLDYFSIPRFENLNFSMANAVYDWCKGDSLGSIVTKHGIQEGAFVRLVLRLEECCREMINVLLLIGGDELQIKFKKCSEILKRDIVFLPSLYI